jgi:hypothetical protein
VAVVVHAQHDESAVGHGHRWDDGGEVGHATLDVQALMLDASDQRPEASESHRVAEVVEPEVTSHQADLREHGCAVAETPLVVDTSV